jgi:hypothetical protein
MMSAEHHFSTRYYIEARNAACMSRERAVFGQGAATLH